MLKMVDKTIEQMETQRPGIKELIHRFEGADLLPCPRCGSEDTASVQVGIVGVTIHIAAATTKFKLIDNGPKPDQYFCNQCREYFD